MAPKRRASSDRTTSRKRKRGSSESPKSATDTFLKKGFNVELKQVGNVLAWSYFSAYVKKIMEGFKGRRTDYRTRTKSTFINKLYILIPKDAKCPKDGKTLDDVDPAMSPVCTDLKDTLVAVKKRGGSKRAYMNTVWRITKDTESGIKEIRLLAEYATILKTLAEFPPKHMSEENKADQVDAFREELEKLIEYNLKPNKQKLIELVDIPKGKMHNISNILWQKVHNNH